MRIQRLGPFARRFLETHRTARISAVFARSFHLEAGEDALCVVDSPLGDGALNAIADLRNDFLSSLRAGEACEIVAGVLRIEGAATLPFAGAAIWTPPASMRREGWRNALADFADAALARAPQDGVFRAAHDRSFVPDTMLARALQAKARDFAAWLANGEENGSPPPVAGLIGLGTGLTPSGDDMVGGAMIAQRWLRRDETARRIAEALAALGSDATTILSGAMLRAAANGVGGAALHDVLAAIGENDATRAIALLDRIDRIGHTSGWDALAGALAALRA